MRWLAVMIGVLVGCGFVQPERRRVDAGVGSDGGQLGDAGAAGDGSPPADAAGPDSSAGWFGGLCNRPNDAGIRICYEQNAVCINGGTSCSRFCGGGLPACQAPFPLCRTLSFSVDSSIGATGNCDN